MKYFITTLLILVFQNLLAQNYQYDINGRSFDDSLAKEVQQDIKVIREDGIEYVLEETASNQKRKPNFENTDLDSNYIYHQVGIGENIETILNLYQICAPCFAEWNNFEREYEEFPIAGENRKLKTIPSAVKKIMFEYLKTFELYEGEYLKVVRKEDYYNTTPTQPKKRYIYHTFQEQMWLYDITEQYGISVYELRSLNNLSDETYEIEGNTTLIIGQVEYKYVCPCLK